jgi:hypothetical protein
VHLMRALVVAGLLAAAGSVASAQSDTDRQFEAGRSADLQNWEWRARQGLAPTEAEKAAQAVVEAISRRDCGQAASQLNAGLAKGHPELMLLAGAMYEDGVCLKPNWERAQSFYEKAAAAGRSEAVARIAAGYAAPAGGRDAAASLWWAFKAKTAMPAACTQVRNLADDPDRFVAALNGWPAGQLGACVYAAAVMATIQGEIATPDTATAYGLQGTVRLDFAPEQGRIDIAEELSAAPRSAGVVADATQRESGLRAARAALSTRLRQVTDRALKRYDKPAGIDPTWQATVTWIFELR